MGYVPLVGHPQHLAAKVQLASPSKGHLGADTVHRVVREACPVLGGTGGMPADTDNLRLEPRQWYIVVFRSGQLMNSLRNRFATLCLLFRLASGQLIQMWFFVGFGDRERQCFRFECCCRQIKLSWHFGTLVQVSERWSFQWRLERVVLVVGKLNYLGTFGPIFESAPGPC